MNIRVATILDVEFIKDIGVRTCLHARPHKQPDEEHLLLQAMYMVENGIIFISNNGEQDTGIICGMINENIWYPDERNLVELFWFVDEEFRGTSAALRLMRAFINYGKEQNVNHVVMSVEAHSPLSDDVYTKRGFQLFEKAFVMEV
jgi:RimJ/RimL family protein N-acetyltransferase